MIFDSKYGKFSGYLKNRVDNLRDWWKEGLAKGGRLSLIFPIQIKLLVFVK